MTNQQNLEQEWAVLQHQFDSYEKYSLLIKLVSISLLGVAYFTNNISIILLCLALILWLQDAIWKTFQARIETRLLMLESAIKHAADHPATSHQFNAQFAENRPGTVGLLIEYAKQSLRPTIAYPHFLLVALIVYLLTT